MKELTFEVGMKKEDTIASLIKAVNEISCKIYVNLENNFVKVEEVEESMIDTVIELICNYYSVTNVEIDNVVDKTKTTINEDLLDMMKYRNVEIDNELICNRMNGLRKTINFALKNGKATPEQIAISILTCTSEISMKYIQDNILEVSEGDIVNVNYGVHIQGEVNGGYRYAIVCKKNDNIAYVVPLSKFKENDNTLSLSMDEQDYDASSQIDEVVNLEKGGYINVKRFQEVVGKVKPEFFEKILEKIADALNFSKEQPDENNNIMSQEAVLEKTLEFALEKIDKSKDCREQAEAFLSNIGMSTKPIIVDAFAVACDVEKVKYSSIIKELCKKYDVKGKNMKLILVEAFKEWAKKYPDVTEMVKRFHNATIVSLIKVFVKKMKNL